MKRKSYQDSFIPDFVIMTGAAASLGSGSVWHIALSVLVTTFIKITAQLFDTTIKIEENPSDEN